MKIKLFIQLLAIALLFAQCKKVNNKNNSVITDSVNVSPSDSITYSLVSPIDIINEVIKENVEYKSGILNPLSNSSKYINSKNQALNLGVYYADFSYLCLTKNTSLSIEYYKKIVEMSQNLNISCFLSDNDFNRIQNNLTNPDSLKLIANKIYYEMVNNMESSDQHMVLTLISIGAIVESLYLSSINIDDFSKYESRIKRLCQQGYAFNNLYAYTKTNNSNDDVKSFQIYLESIRMIFDQFELNKTKTTIIKEKDNHYIFKGGDEVFVDKELLKKLIGNVNTTRTYIINDTIE